MTASYTKVVGQVVSYMEMNVSIYEKHTIITSAITVQNPALNAELTNIEKVLNRCAAFPGPKTYTSRRHWDGPGFKV